MKVCCVFSLEPPHQVDPNEHIQHTIINIKRKSPEISQIQFIMSAAIRSVLLRTQERVRNSSYKRAISVRAIVVLLYTKSRAP